MKKIFLVQGSAEEPYEVEFQKDGDNLNCYCTCPAGQNGMYCKHRFNILKGISKGIVSDNAAEVPEVASWLPGTDVAAAIVTVENIEQEAAAIKKKLSTAKKALATAMRK